jgi:hypothetical protein
VTGNTPPGWTRTSLGDVFELKYGKALPERLRQPGPVAVYGSAGKVGNHVQALTSGPTIILGRKGSVGEIELSREQCWPIDTTYYIDEFIGQDPAFWMWLLKHCNLGLLDSSTAVPGLNRQDAYRVEIHLPALAEQRRIVARIEALFARTRRARADLERVAPLARHHRDRVLVKAFDGEWPEVPVSTLAAATFDGPFGSHLKSDDYTPAGTRVVRLENIGHLSFIGEKETFIAEAKGRELARHRLQADDVLFSSFVDKEVRVCLLPADLPTEAINKADCFCIRVDRDQCDPRFLAYRLASPRTYEDMRDAVHGATRPRIGLGDLKRYRVPLPALDEQIRTVGAIEQAHQATARAEHQAARALALLDRLEQSILAKAFRGELVPQDPSDEPAAVTLAKTQASGAAPAQRSRRSGRPAKRPPARSQAG